MFVASSPTLTHAPLLPGCAAQGKVVRRVMAPGAPLQNALHTELAQQAQALHRQVVAAWQQSLHHVAPSLALDQVVDVLAARNSRVVLLTDRHIAYLYAKQHASLAADGGGGDRSASAVTYRVKWIVPNHLVDNIRGVEKTYRISIEYRKPISVRDYV